MTERAEEREKEQVKEREMERVMERAESDGASDGEEASADLQEGLHVQAAVADLPHHVVPAAGIGTAPAASHPLFGAGGDALPPRSTAGAPRVAGAGGGAAVGLEMPQALAGGGLAVVGALVEGLLETLLAHERAGPLAFGVAC